MVKEKKNASSILLVSATLLCLLCLNTIGVVKKAFAAPTAHLQCRVGERCAQDFFGDEGYCDYYWAGAGCACVDWIGSSSEAMSCWVT